MVALALLALASLVSLVRTARGDAPDARPALTKHVAYLAAALLTLAEVLAPARWLPGAVVAAFELALAVDMLLLARPPRAALEKR